jgi:hypothetical protein
MKKTSMLFKIIKVNIVFDASLYAFGVLFACLLYGKQ